jgi:uncharacterized membrane protein
VTPDAIAPPFYLAAALLLLAGGVKLVTPRASAQALLDAGLPGSRALARGVGAAEVLVGLWALSAPGTGGAVALGLLYLVFAVFLAYVLRTHPDAGSCGCAGPTPVPPSLLHLTLNAIAALAGLAYAATSAPDAREWLASLGWGAVPVMGGLALAGWLAIVAVTSAPAAFRAWQAPVDEHEHEHGDRPHAPHGHDHVAADHDLASSGITFGHPSLWPGIKEAG